MYKLAIVCGGNSLESDISVVTALKAAAVLKTYGSDYIFIYQNKDGTFYEYRGTPDLKSFVGGKLKKGYFGKDKNAPFFAVGFAKRHFDVIWPLVHGKGTEDGTTKAYFDTLRLPTIGNEISVSGLLQNKELFKHWARQLGLPTIKHYMVRSSDLTQKRPHLKSGFSYPVVVKPNSLGSSIGIGKANSDDELQECLSEALNYDSEAIVEKFCEGLIEYNVALLRKEDVIVYSAIEEVNSSDNVLSFDDKYVNDIPHRIPAAIDDDLRDQINGLAAKAYSELNLTGPVRFDFMFSRTKSKLYLNEINTIPGSLAMDLFEKAGMTKKELIDITITDGILRHNNRERLKSDYPNSDFKRLTGKSKLK